jgi:uncharacterized protein YjbI with pentapeptide repeats
MSTIHPPKLPKPLPAGSLEQLVDHVECTECGITGGDFTAQIASDVIFEQAQLRRVHFMQTRLNRLRLSDVRIEACDFSGATWEKPRLRRSEFIGCRLMGVQWIEAQLDDVVFKDCTLEGAVLVNATCKAVRFEKCILRGAFLEESDLSGVVFAQCDLTNASLRESTMQEADLRGSILNGVQANAKDLRGAIIEPGQAIQVVGLLGVTVLEQGDEQ